MSDYLDLSRPGVIEASAGTGKTWTINEIYKKLILGKSRHGNDESSQAGAAGSEIEKSLCRVDEILVVTFTNAATAELRERIQNGIEDELAETTNEEDRIRLRLAATSFDNAQICTIHSFCNEILTTFFLECGVPENVSAGENIEPERIYFAQKYCAEKALSGTDADRIFWGSGEIPGLVAGVWSEMEKHAERLTLGGNAGGKETRARFKMILDEGFDAWRKYRRSRIARTASVSFDESLIIVREALAKENSTLAEKIAARYKVAIIDEAQDTDGIQADIFSRVFLDTGRRLFFIGDPKQAIYSFRGGDVKAYSAMRDKILSEKSAGKGNCFTLGKNYRSTQAIITGVNKVFEIEPDLFVKKFKEFGGDARTSEEFRVPACAKGNKSGEREFSPERAFFYEDSESGMPREERCAEIIAGLVGKGVPAERIAVLGRGNDILREIKNLLAEKNVPAVCTAEESVYETGEALLLHSLLRGMLGEIKGEYLKYLYCSPLFRAQKTFSEFRETLIAARGVWETDGLLRAAAVLNEKFEIYKNLEDKQSIANFSQLLELTASDAALEKTEPKQTLELLAQKIAKPDLSDDAQKTRLPGSAPAVRLETIHKSKGLEYDIVVLPDLTDTAYGKKQRSAYAVSDDRKSLIFGELDPDACRNAQDRTNLRDLTCISYVALTRAKYFCILLGRKGKNTGPAYLRELLEFRRECNLFDEKEWSAKIDSDYIAANLPAENFAGDGTRERVSDENTVREVKEKNERLRERRHADSWRTSSYSGIMRRREEKSGETADERLREQLDEDAEIEDAAEFVPGEKKYTQDARWAELPAGTDFGTSVHEIFSEIDVGDFDASADREIAARIVNARDFEKYKALVSATFRELPLVAGKPLCGFDGKNDLRREMEFYLSVNQKGRFLRELEKICRSRGGVYEKTFERHFAAAAGANETLDGLLTGSIDAVLRDAGTGKYYVIDWKTNVVKKNVPAIGPGEIEAEIIGHGYALQWLFYCAALRTFLRKSGCRGNGLIGGVRYVFVRWQAVYETEIDDALLDELDRAFGNA